MTTELRIILQAADAMSRDRQRERERSEREQELHDVEPTDAYLEGMDDDGE